MSGIWRRLSRLLGQSRIRLSPSEVALPRYRAGDRLEIAGRIWRIVRVSPAALGLVALEGPPVCRWLALGEVDPCDLIHYPIAAATDEGAGLES